MASAQPVQETRAERSYRTTGLQRSMVLASLKSPESAVYQMQLVVRLKQPVDHANFQEAVRTCFARHAGLMARFELRDEEVFQSRLTIECPSGEFRDLVAQTGTSDEKLSAFLAEDTRTPFPLGEDRPAWRSTFLQLTPSDQVWVWNHHHAICDAGSLQGVITEVFATYDQLCAGQQPSRAPVSPDMLDHLAWLEDQDWRPREREWRRRLSANDIATELPEIRGIDGCEMRTGAALRRTAVRIDAETQNALQRLIEETGLTANTLLTGALALWLGRMTSRDRVVFGTMRAARRSSIPGAETIVGPLTNTVPVAIDLPNETSVTNWLQTLRQDSIALRELEHCSLGQIMDWTGFNHPSAGLPLLLNFRRDTIEARLQASNLSERCSAELNQTNDLGLIVGGFERPSPWFEVIWRQDRMPEATAQSLALGLGEALRAFVRDLHQPLGAISLLNEQQRSLIEGAARSRQQIAAPTFAQALIEQRIREQPDAPALITPQGTTTYRQLSVAADKAALAVARDDIVAVLLPPGPEVAAVMLGMLRRGAVFFLINPSAPTAEQSAMLRRLKVQTAIVAETLDEEIAPPVKRVLTFAEIEARPAVPENVGGEIESGDLAYLVHTSGSTGEKKFVEVEHGSLAQALAALVNLYGITPSDRRIARASPGTDYFISEILVTLSGGGAVVFPPKNEALGIREFLEELRRARISVTGLPASYWHEWVRQMGDDGAKDLPPELRLVITGMERVSPHAVAKWRRAIGDRVRLLNVYGPAETTLIVTASELTDHAPRDPLNVRIGQPIVGAEVRVLNHLLQPLPPGIIGELCIGGTGIARGYHGDEIATREKFVPDPFHRNGARLYRTGDYGYLDADGQFVFIGRRDEQVKIRGHRVELGEIEAILQRHTAVQQAVATLAGDDTDQWLVAHIVADDSLDETQLRSWVRTQLAPHLQPAEFVIVDRFPTLRSGKIDRAALARAYRESHQESAVDYDDSVAGKLHRFWHELLGRRDFILASDNFFDCGGDSLKAVRLLAGIEERLGVSLSFQDLFAHPTIASLAAVIEGGNHSLGYTALSRLNQTRAGTPLIIVHGWGGGVFHTVDFARRLDDTRSVFGLQAVEQAGRERHRSVEEMASHYADEVMRECGIGPTDLLGHSLGGVIAYATACELASRGHRVGKLFIVDTIPSNLPKWVHVKFLTPYFRSRLRGHVLTLFQTPPHRWHRFVRARRRRLHALMQKRRALDVPKSPHTQRKYDYYRELAEQFVPERVNFDLRLLTPDDNPIDIYWRYLVGDKVRVTRLHSGHVDMFAPENLDSFIAAFQEASAENSINTKPVSVANN